MGPESQRNLERIVDNLGELPAMPEVLAEVLRLMDDPGVEVPRVSAAIERDPAIAAKLLRVSNSSYYSLKRQVSTVKLALVILGLREVRNMVMAMSLFTAVAGDLVHSSLAHVLWRHSLLVAGLSKRLGTTLRLGLQGEDFVAGLLHDLGKLVLWTRLGQQYQALLEHTDEADLHRREVSTLGFTHAHVGAALLRYWELPDVLSDAVHLHHTEERAFLEQAANPALAALVRLANLTAHDEFDSPGEVGPEALRAQATWEILDRLPVPLPPPHRFEVLAGLKADVRSSTVPDL